MASPPSQSLVRPATDRELMPPPAKRIKRPAKVLDEDAYTDGLSKIIARDYFPGLLEAQSQQEYLDALKSQDQGWIDSARRRLTEVMTPGASRGRRGTSLAPSYQPATDTPRTAAGLETPMSTTSSVAESATTSKPAVDIDMSLSSFQARYTSEDNESFNKLLDKQNTKRAQRYSWLWAGNTIPSARQLLHRDRDRKLLMEKGAAASVGNAGESEKQLIVGLDERKAMPDTWDAKPNNEIFFAPEGVEDELETVQQRAEAASKAGPKAVVYDNTRLPAPRPDPDLSVPPSPSVSAIQDAIAGRPRSTASEADDHGGHTPRVNGYSFVDDEPTSAELSLHSASNQLTSGPSGDAPSNPFKIQQQSKRESLHHRMVDRVAKRNRAASRSTALSSVASTPMVGLLGTPGTPRPSARGNLTPAARRLWAKVGGTPRTTAGGGSSSSASSFGGSMGGSGKGATKHARSGSILSSGSGSGSGSGPGSSSPRLLRWTPTPKVRPKEQPPNKQKGQ